MGKFLTVSAASRRSASEIDFVILSPFLLAVALALRITKVTGELRLDRAAPTAKNDIVDEQPWPVGEPESNLKPAEDQPHSPGSGMIGDVVEARTPPPEG
jgi:hypothetical protein